MISPSFSVNLRSIGSRMVVLLAFSVLVCAGSGCDIIEGSGKDKPAPSAPTNESRDSGFTELKESTERSLNDLQRMLSDLAPSKDDLKSLTTDEIKKLSTFEYHVMEFSKEANTLDIEERLANAGQERWECFAVQPIETGLRMFCRRRPETYLRYVPRFFP